MSTCNRITLASRDDFLDYREGSGGTIEIFDIQVGSERGVGRGRKLVQALFLRLRPDTRVFAITRSENEVAQQFYEALGFQIAGNLRRFYSEEHGIDAVMYVRKAGGPI